MNELKAIELVEMFQCPGCVCGSNVRCGKFKRRYEVAAACAGHVLGTFVGGVGTIALGLPKGFCRPGVEDQAADSWSTRVRIDVRLWAAGTVPEWDRCNVAVWAMEKDGFLFVRTYCPRINVSYVDVVEGGKLDLVPNALDVGTFIDEID